jgi:hypothetical protein
MHRLLRRPSFRFHDGREALKLVSLAASSGRRFLAAKNLEAADRNLRLAFRRKSDKQRGAYPDDRQGA